MALQRSARQYMGVRAIAPPDLIVADRAPGVNDLAYVKGTLWLYPAGLASYQFSGVSWIELGTGVVGDIATLTGDSGGAIAPVGANVSILGTAAHGIITTGTPGTITISAATISESQRSTIALASPAEAVSGLLANKAIAPTTLVSKMSAPGTIGNVTPGAATFTDLTAVGTVNLNASGAGVTTIGTGGTGAVNIGNATGNTAVTGTLTSTAGITATTGNITASAGNLVATLGSVSAATTVTAGTGITATTGDITASAGDLIAVIGDVIIGGELVVNSGAATDFAGQATLTNGTVSVANTNIAANDMVLVSRQGVNGSTALGVFDVAIVAATSFSITARKTADATTETNDTSIVDYLIVRKL